MLKYAAVTKVDNKYKYTITFFDNIKQFRKRKRVVKRGSQWYWRDYYPRGEKGRKHIVNGSNITPQLASLYVNTK